VYATDYRNNIFTNYYDLGQGGWLGWKQLISVGDRDYVNTNLNSMTSRGQFYVDPGTLNKPSGNWGTLNVTSFWDKSSVTQQFIDGETGETYTRAWTGFVWTEWKNYVTASDTQEQLWSGGEGWYMHATQTVTPIKKLSQCRNGWILVWSDYTPGGVSDNFDINYSYIPKGTPFKSGHSHLFTVPNYQSATSIDYTIKKLKVYDTKLEGHADNSIAATSTNDVVLRYVLEW
jgi:hypothetical protein